MYRIGPVLVLQFDCVLCGCLHGRRNFYCFCNVRSDNENSFFWIFFILISHTSQRVSLSLPPNLQCSVSFICCCPSIIATVSVCLVPVVVLVTVPRKFICCSSSLFVCRLLQLCRCVLPQWLSYWLFQGGSSVAVLLCLYVGHCNYCNCAVVSCPSGCPTDCSKAIHLLQFFFVLCRLLQLCRCVLPH